MSSTRALRRAYPLMRRRFGHQNWWPGDSPFEVAVGAILTQNTSWRNVERAIAHLKQSGVLSPEKMFALPAADLAELIRPAGYDNLKARRLRNFLSVLVGRHGGRLGHMLAGPTPDVRARLLAINGIGRETADSILLYAGRHPSFVVDAYTKRIFERHGWWRSLVARSKSQAPRLYESLKALCEQSLGHRPKHALVDYWRDYHAQLVVVGKDFCRPASPRCEDCPLRSLLPHPA